MLQRSFLATNASPKVSFSMGNTCGYSILLGTIFLLLIFHCRRGVDFIRLMTTPHQWARELHFPGLFFRRVFHIDIWQRWS